MTEDGWLGALARTASRGSQDVGEVMYGVRVVVWRDDEHIVVSSGCVLGGSRDQGGAQWILSQELSGSTAGIGARNERYRGSFRVAHSKRRCGLPPCTSPEETRKGGARLPAWLSSISRPQSNFLEDDIHGVTRPPHSSTTHIGFHPTRHGVRIRLERRYAQPNPPMANNGIT